MDEYILSDITAFNGETTVDVSKIMPNVELEKIRIGTNDVHIESFCLVPSQQGDLIVSTSKKFLFIQTEDTKCKVEIPKMMESLKTIFNLGHYL